MKYTPAALILAVTLAAPVACSDSSPVDVEPPPDADPLLVESPLAAASTTLGVDGDWSWERVEQLRMPRWVVEDVVNPAPGPDILPEGPNTHARCVAEGHMTLTQTGDEFEGSMIVTSSQCETQGGQLFQGPSAGLPVQVLDGAIRGRSLAFSWGNMIVTPCPTQAVVTDMDGDVATAFSGGGRCVLPGHPQSGSVLPLEPPPGGTSTTLTFDAWR